MQIKIRNGTVEPCADYAFGSEAPPRRRKALGGSRRRAAQTSLPAAARLQKCGRIVLVPEGGQDSIDMGDGEPIMKIKDIRIYRVESYRVVQLDFTHEM